MREYFQSVLMMLLLSIVQSVLAYELWGFIARVDLAFVFVFSWSVFRRSTVSAPFLAFSIGSLADLFFEHIYGIQSLLCTLGHLLICSLRRNMPFWGELPWSWVITLPLVVSSVLLRHFLLWLGMDRSGHIGVPFLAVFQEFLGTLLVTALWVFIRSVKNRKPLGVIL